MVQPPCTVQKNKSCINSERSNYVPRHVLIDAIPSRDRALFQRAWALLLATHRGNCIIACLITVIPFYSIPFHSMPFEAIYIKG